MPAKKVQTMAPREARSLEDVCRLQTDHRNVKSGWLMYDGGEVSITNQRSGEPSTATVVFPAREFDALARWWGRQQRLRAR